MLKYSCDEIIIDMGGWPDYFIMHMLYCYFKLKHKSKFILVAGPYTVVAYSRDKYCRNRWLTTIHLSSSMTCVASIFFWHHGQLTHKTVNENLWSPMERFSIHTRSVEAGCTIYIPVELERKYLQDGNERNAKKGKIYWLGKMAESDIRCRPSI